MYAVKRYTISRARERLADVLDEVDRTGSVVIERRDVQYVIRAKRASRKSGAGRSMIDVLDPAVAEGQWQWNWTAKGLDFGRRGRRR
jgi:hypothetical protein